MKEGGRDVVDTAATTGPPCVSNCSNGGSPRAMIADATTESCRVAVELAAMAGPPRVSSCSDCRLPYVVLAAGATAAQD